MFPFLASCAIVKVAQKRQDKNLNGLLGYFKFCLDGEYNTLYLGWLGYLPQTWRNVRRIKVSVGFKRDVVGCLTSELEWLHPTTVTSLK